MKLWLLKRTDEVGWDQGRAFVVRAETEAEARQLASNEAGDYREPTDKWADPSFSTCTELTSDGAPEIILEDFKAG